MFTAEEPKPRRPLVGTNVTVAATFRSFSNNVLMDPIDPTIFVESPDETEYTYPTDQLTHVSTGIWTISFLVDLPGQWYIRAYATDAVAAVVEGFLIVRPSRTSVGNVGNFLLTEDGDFLDTEDGDFLIWQAH